MSAVFERRTVLPVGAPEAFAWHANPGAFQRLLPGWERATVEGPPRALELGQRIAIRVGLGPLMLPWVARITALEPGRRFVDEQERGPFRHWRHEHRIEPRGEHTCELVDHIDYEPPFGGLGRLLGGSLVRAKLERLFRYRHEVTARDLAQLHPRSGGPSMKIVVTGSSGLVGSHLVPFLTAGGHQVLRLVRREARAADEVRWDPASGEGELDKLEGVDAVVHLAGEGIADGRWSEARKRRIRDSRVEGTRNLVTFLGRLSSPPKVWVNASAIGLYGSRGDELLDERSNAGSDYLAEVCKAWEAEAGKACSSSTRVVLLRFGVILSARGGALAKMLLPFQMGGGGILGDGNQWMSWISLDDVLGAIHHALVTDELSGAVNTVAPEPVTNRVYTRTLGRVLRRPTVLPMPGFAARLAFGEMADALLLASQRVRPARLVESGYRFRHTDLESALRHVLGRPSASRAGQAAHA